MVLCVTCVCVTEFSLSLSYEKLGPSAIGLKHVTVSSLYYEIHKSFLDAIIYTSTVNSS